MDSYLFELSYSIAIFALLILFLKKSSLYSGKRLVFHWATFGFIVNLYGLSWLYTVYPLLWIKEGFIQIVGIAIIHFSLALAVSLPYGIIGKTTSWNAKRIFVPAIFASSLVVSELFRSLILSLFLLGEGTSINLHFTAGTIGNSLSVTPFIEFAYFGGTFALTFIAGYFAYIFHMKKNIEDYYTHVILFLTLFISTHYLAPVEKPAPGTTIGVVTTNFEGVEKDNEEEYSRAFREQKNILHKETFSFASSSPDILIYPEDTRYLSHLNENELKELNTVFPNTLFIDGDLLPTKNGFSNISVFYNKDLDKTLVRGKEFLLPFNEYLPYIFRSAFKLFVEKEELDKYERLHTYTPIYSEKTIEFNGMRIGTLLCSEILTYKVINGISKENPSIVFFQSRLHVFHNNPWFIMHLRSFTKIAAAQLRTQFITSTAGAPSFIISPYGKIERYIPTGFSTSTYTIH